MAGDDWAAEEGRADTYVGSDHVDWLRAEGLLSEGSQPPPGPEWQGGDEDVDSGSESGRLDWDRFFSGSLDLERSGIEIERILYWDPDPDFHDLLANQGFDVLAWYRQMHFNGPGWGITVRASAVSRLAGEIRWKLRLDPSDLEPAEQADLVARLKRAAFLLLFQHEVYHHKVESLATRLELVDGLSRYWEYSANRYRPHFLTDDCIEEALANAHAYRWFANRSPRRDGLKAQVHRAAREWMEDWFPHLPPGYRNAPRYLDDADFDSGEATLATWINNRPSRGERELGLAQPLADPFFEWDIPTHVLNDATLAHADLPIGFYRYGTLSWRDAVKILRQHGLEVVPGGKGSHIKMTRDGLARPVIIPHERSIAPGTAKTILGAIDKRLRDIPELKQAI